MFSSIDGHRKRDPQGKDVEGDREVVLISLRQHYTKEESSRKKIRELLAIKALAQRSIGQADAQNTDKETLGREEDFWRHTLKSFSGEIQSTHATHLPGHIPIFTTAGTELSPFGPPPLP